MFRLNRIFAVLLLIMLCCAQGCGIPTTPVQASNRSQSENASATTGILPTFEASLTEALLQPEALFPLGTYNNREFGCCGTRHLGHDFKASAGTPVKALAPGVVLPTPISGPHCNYGNVVAVWSKLIDGTDFVLVYGHLSGRPGMEPTLSGSVHRGDIIGYVGHSGGSSPSGSRCGTDDENGDGDEHVHIGLRMGSPPVNPNSVMRWVYYGYAGNGEDADYDANGNPHFGKFTSIARFADCHGTHAGLTPAGTWAPVSGDMMQAYCNKGGYHILGDSQDFGHGNGMSTWGGTYCQNFRQQNTPILEALSICLNLNRNRGFSLPWKSWTAFSMSELSAQLGAPEDEPTPTGTDTWSQRFEHGTVSWTNTLPSPVGISLDNGSIYLLDGDNLTDPTVKHPTSTSSSSSSSSSSDSSSSSTSGTNSHLDSSSTSDPDSSSSSSGSSSTNPSSRAQTQESNAEDPPYTTCDRFGFNKVVNGEFNLDPLACGWTLENHLGGSHANQVCYPDGTCFAELWTTTPNDPWQSQLKQYVSIYQGYTYRFRFKAKASYADRFIVQLMKEDSPWTNYGIWMDVEVPAGIWQEFTLDFRATTTDTYARIAFQFGQTGTHFMVDKIWMEQLPQ